MSGVVGSTQKQERKVAINKTIHVVDAMMGQGKTSAAITYINRSPAQRRFFFLTPYVREGHRIAQACPDRQIVVLEEKKGSKLNDLRYRVNRHENVASTHALFERYTPDILEKIRDGHYTLILDEAYAVSKTITDTLKKNFLCLLNNGIVSVDPKTHLAYFTDGTARGFDSTTMKDIIDRIAAQTVYYYDNKLLIWIFPVEILEAFDEVIVMTYLFQAQHIYYYLQINGATFDYWGTRKLPDGQYEFCPIGEATPFAPNLNVLINILDDQKLNAIGSSPKALCSKWAKADLAHRGGSSIEQLGRNVRNVQKNIYQCSTKDFMWTCYKNERELMEDKNLKYNWVQCTEKATNEWKNRHYLAYCVNLHEHPDIYDYFEMMGLTPDQDRWALSEMIQWIWRSAIRDGEEIWIYIPSKRMRTLLENWIDEVSSTGLEGGDDVVTVSPYPNPAEDAGEKNIA